MASKEVQGVQVGGREPKALLLTDGTRLSLEDEGPGGRADWTVVGEDEAAAVTPLSVSDAVQLAGDDHAEYVRVRTRAEVAWLRVVAEWFDDEAERLDRELAVA